MKKLLIAVMALALVCGPIGAMAAGTPVNVTVNVAEGISLTLNSSNALTFNLDPSGTATDVGQTTSLTVKTNSADGYNVSLATSGFTGIGVNQIPDADWHLEAVGSQKGFYVTSDDSDCLGNLVTGAKVIAGTAPTGNAGETGLITNKIAVDWSVSDTSLGALIGAITYTAAATP